MILDSSIFELATKRVKASERPNFKNSRSLFFDEANGGDLTHDKFAELMLAAFIKRPQRFRFAKANSNDDLNKECLLWVVFNVEPIKEEKSKINIDTFEVFYPVKFADRFRAVTGVKLDLFDLRFGCLEITYCSKYLSNEVVDTFEKQPNFDEVCARYAIKIIKYKDRFLHRAI